MKRALTIKGMHCESCSKMIAMDLEELGVKSRIDHKSGKAEVEFDESKTSLDSIKDAIKKAGYTVN